MELGVCDLQLSLMCLLQKTLLFPALVFFWVLFCCCLPLLTTHMVKFRDFCSKCFNWLYMVAIFHYQQYYSLGRQGSYLSELTLESCPFCLHSWYHVTLITLFLKVLLLQLFDLLFPCVCIIWQSATPAKAAVLPFAQGTGQWKLLISFQLSFM